MEIDMAEWLNSEIERFPARASGEELYKHFEKLSKRAVHEDRESFIATMSQWLRLQSEPKTMIAVDIAGRYKLLELEQELKKLLSDVSSGKSFKPFYGRPIRKSLAKICSTEEEPDI